MKWEKQEVLLVGKVRGEVGKAGGPPSVLVGKVRGEVGKAGGPPGGKSER